MLEPQDLHPIGIGTFWLWAERYETRSEDNNDTSKYASDTKALKYQHERWQNFLEASYIYAGGQTMKFLWEFLKTIDRESIYVSTKIENFAETPEDIEKQLDKYLQIMGLEYVDEYAMHTPFVSKFPILEAYQYMQKLVKKGKVRYLKTSNMNYEQLISLNENFDIKTFEWLYNLECKQNEDVWIIEYCKQNNIRFLCYQPFRRNRTANRNYPILTDLSRKYNKTQNQIILNRIIREKKISALIKTANVSRVDENLDALNFTIEQTDVAKLNAFRQQEFDQVHLDRDADPEGKNWVYIRKLANQFA